MTRILRTATAVAALLAASWMPGVGHAEDLAVGGTGAALGLFKSLSEAYAKHDPSVQIEVVDGLGSGGGIKAVTKGAIGLSASGRKLKPEEQAAGLREIAWYTTPIAFVTSQANPNGLEAAQLSGIYSDPSAKWADGTSIRIILRPEDDSTTKWLIKNFPGMEEALKEVYARSEVPVTGTEGENLDLAETLPGSLAASVLSAVLSEGRNLRMIPVDGVAPTAENMAAGTYPYANPVYIVLPADPSPAAERFVAFLGSAEAAQIVRAAGGVMDMPSTGMTQ
jgi:phosphate transport system substrate-binding protein